MESFQIENSKFQNPKFLYALVVELVDTQDLKSCGHCGRIGSIPIRGTCEKKVRMKVLTFFVLKKTCTLKITLNIDSS